VAKYRTKPIAVEAWVVSELTVPLCESPEAAATVPGVIRAALQAGVLQTAKFWMVDGVGFVVLTPQDPDQPLQAKPTDILSVDERGEFYVWEPSVFHETHEAVEFVDAPRVDALPAMSDVMAAVKRVSE
jgi:hypothetical protein